MRRKLKYKHRPPVCEPMPIGLVGMLEMMTDLMRREIAVFEFVAELRKHEAQQAMIIRDAYGATLQ